MRTNFELWLIVEQNFDEYFHNGICETLIILEMRGIISTMERNYLQSEINEYGNARFYYSKYIRGNYFWKMREKKPRRIFIHRQILKAIRNE